MGTIARKWRFIRVFRVLQAKHPQESGVHVQGNRRHEGKMPSWQDTSESMQSLQAAQVLSSQHEQRRWVALLQYKKKRFLYVRNWFCQSLLFLLTLHKNFVIFNWLLVKWLARKIKTSSICLGYPTSLRRPPLILPFTIE